MKKTWLKNWELALLLALCITLSTGAWAERESAALAARVVRLHVVAVSDDAEEQRIKLAVRDRVLACAAPLLEDAADAAEARVILSAALSDIKAAAEEAAEGRPVTVTLDAEQYPTRSYEGFSLPAGTYDSLRVVLGAGEGHNWWCVVFPPLCLSASEVSEAMDTLPEDSAALITEDGEGYVIKFRLLELWGELKALLTQ